MLVQSVFYGLMLGVLCAIPASIPFMVDMGGVAFVFLGITYVGAIPAVVAGAITWCLVVWCQRGQHRSPLPVLTLCFLGTATGAYLLVPVWTVVQSLWGKCQLFGTWSSLKLCLHGHAPTANGLSGILVIGFMVTAPIVLPLLFFGAWLWVRRLQPRLVGERHATVTSGT